MVTRINGAPAQGVWFSADVAFLQVTVVGSTFLTDLTVTTTDPRQADLVNSDLEQVLEILAQRGTILGLNVDSDTVIQTMVDYGQAFVDEGTTLGGQAAQDITTVLEAEIDAIAGLSSAAIVISRGFSQAAVGTPA
jgi:hypothetical protein